MGLPEPLKARPSIYSEMGISMVWPVNSQWVYKLSIPDVPSKILSKGKIYLNHGPLAWDLEHLSHSLWPITQVHFHNFSVLGELHIVKDNQRSIYLHHCPVVDPWSDVVVTSDSLHICIECLTWIHVDIIYTLQKQQQIYTFIKNKIY